MRMILGQLTIRGIVSTLPVAVITCLLATYWFARPIKTAEHLFEVFE
jgi:hypothetical protein